MIFFALLFFAEPAGVAAAADPKPHPVAVVQEFFDRIAPKLKVAPDRPLSAEEHRASREKLVKELSAVKSVTITVPDRNCPRGRCLMLDFSNKSSRGEFVYLAIDAFRDMGLYGEEMGWGNYPRPEIPKNRRFSDIKFDWINWSACTAHSWAYIVDCESSYSRIFTGQVARPSGYRIIFQTSGLNIIRIEIQFDNKEFYENSKRKAASRTQASEVHRASGRF